MQEPAVTKEVPLTKLLSKPENNRPSSSFSGLVDPLDIGHLPISPAGIGCISAADRSTRPTNDEDEAVN